METLSNALRKIASQRYWVERIGTDFGIAMVNADGSEVDPIIARSCHQILSILRPSLVRACGINKLLVRSDMGPNRPYYPNHGYFVDNSVTLNADIFYNPDVPHDFVDHHGYFCNRPTQTLLHEFGHGYDEYNDMPSLKEPWLKLSGWSEQSRPGLKRLVIRDRGAPPVIGEWYFRPDAGFTRFYAKRNPWDDFADSFAFFMARLPDKLPEPKRGYFEALLRSYD